MLWMAAIADKVSLSKAAIDQDNYLNNCLEAIQSVYPACTDFQREFPSVSFSIATGVGKTRLMGACIAYLYLEKGVRNFFILAPNLTIYEKLIRDFGDPSYQHVFNGIAEFENNRPVITRVIIVHRVITLRKVKPYQYLFPVQFK